MDDGIFSFVFAGLFCFKYLSITMTIYMISKYMLRMTEKNPLNWFFKINPLILSKELENSWTWKELNQSKYAAITWCNSKYSIPDNNVE